MSDQYTGTSPTITVALEHSGDRRNWSSKTTLISAVAMGPTSTSVALGNDPGTSPILGFARLKITLGGTSPTARVQVFVCGRSN